MGAPAIRTVAVAGGGMMGCGIAQVFASRPDLSVTIFDSYVSGAAILDRIRGNLALFVGKGVFSQAEADAIVARVTPYGDLAAAVRDADLVVECIPEDMALKQGFFRDLEPLVRPDAILCTNTSVMSITAIASKSAKRDRIVGTHFWNPPTLIPLVEVVKAEDTSDGTVDATIAVLASVGKKPIRVNKDVPGFVANRLQHALWREAVSIVEHGIADAATVDEAVRSSFGLRLPVLGPMENIDMVGADLALSIHDYLFPYLEDAKAASPALREKVAAGDLGFKSGKGFAAWTEEEMAASRRRLTEHLIRMLHGK